jgi:hypothetical protein
MAVVFKNMAWRRVPVAHLASVVVSEISGVYAYAHATAIGGLPIALQWVYVGHTRNLRRRLEEHEDLREPNLELGFWLRTSRGAELWCVPLPFERLAPVEVSLVRELRPKFNRTKYLTTKEKDNGYERQRD